MMNSYKLVMLLNIFFISIGFAEPNKVLIVNTDTTISKYKKIATEFKNTLPKNAYQWLEFDVTAHKTPDNDLKQLIDRENPDSIYCIGSKAYSLSRDYATNRTLVFSAALNWQRLDIDSKTYGISNELSPGQEMTVLRMFFPKLKKIGILYSEEFMDEYVATLKKIAGSHNIEIIDTKITHHSESDSQLNELLPQIDLLWVIADPLVLKSSDSVLRVLEVANQYKKPVYAFSENIVEQGAALSISTSIETIGGQSGNLLMSLDEGRIPADRVQFPAGTSITLNLCAFEKLKIPVNEKMLSSVDQIISCPKK